jgi:hypothetical protein
VKIVIFHPGNSVVAEAMKNQPEPRDKMVRARFGMAPAVQRHPKHAIMTFPVCPHPRRAHGFRKHGYDADAYKVREHGDEHALTYRLDAVGLLTRARSDKEIES